MSLVRSRGNRHPGCAGVRATLTQQDSRPEIGATDDRETLSADVCVGGDGEAAVRASAALRGD